MLVGALWRQEQVGQLEPELEQRTWLGLILLPAKHVPLLRNNKDDLRLRLHPCRLRPLLPWSRLRPSMAICLVRLHRSWPAYRSGLQPFMGLLLLPQLQQLQRHNRLSRPRHNLR